MVKRARSLQSGQSQWFVVGLLIEEKQIERKSEGAVRKVTLAF